LERVKETAMPVLPAIAEVTARIATRSRDSRAAYEARMRAAKPQGPARARLACSNLAHVIAAAQQDQQALKAPAIANIGIVTAYNDMLSAHQPFETYPALIKAAARSVKATAQVAGGVPAMCDGVTQGAEGMELSLFSREVIALAAGVALSHDAFDAAILLGTCDKIVPGLFIGASAFGHLPIIFQPAGPMPTGASNAEKQRVRQLYAEGKATREELLDIETRSYHAPGTCTFYGTANTNQVSMELMGLHVPGTAFVNPGTPLRTALIEAAARRAASLTALGNEYRPFYQIAAARNFVNALVGLMATGGSTNHTLHFVAMARAVGLTITWEDFAAISAVTPQIARIYPNGEADVNQFQAAGGTQFLVRTLIDHGLLHDDAETIWGKGLAPYAREPWLNAGVLEWRDGPEKSLDRDILRGADDPFAPDGGLKLLSGALGRAVVKSSAVKPEHQAITAPARVFDSMIAVDAAFAAGELDRDVVVVLRFQGPRANGMPEMHKITPLLGVLQDRGRHVALVTDGRMSGASGKVLAAIHVTPEALDEGPLARVQDGDVITIDAPRGVLDIRVNRDELMARPPARPDLSGNQAGVGRELFARFRAHVGPADLGASVIL
jgi:phosphogluconate dehydratase